MLVVTDAHSKNLKNSRIIIINLFYTANLLTTFIKEWQKHVLHRHKLLVSRYTANLLAWMDWNCYFLKMKEKVKEQKNAGMKTKSNRANMIKETYLLIMLSNVAIYGG